MKILIASACMTLGLASAAFAQSTDSLCHHAGLTYSPGSMVAMGASMQRCAVTEAGLSVWTPVSSEDATLVSANCVAGGREFGQGSINSTGGVDLNCRNGIWYRDR